MQTVRGVGGMRLFVQHSTARPDFLARSLSRDDRWVCHLLYRMYEFFLVEESSQIRELWVA